jgi:hypothetical protein
MKNLNELYFMLRLYIVNKLKYCVRSRNCFTGGVTFKRCLGRTNVQSHLCFGIHTSVMTALCISKNIGKLVQNGGKFMMETIKLP